MVTCARLRFEEMVFQDWMDWITFIKTKAAFGLLVGAHAIQSSHTSPGAGLYWALNQGTCLLVFSGCSTAFEQLSAGTAVKLGADVVMWVFSQTLGAVDAAGRGHGFPAVNCSLCLFHPPA